MVKKPKVGFIALTGCQGCQLSLLFQEDNILDIIKHIDIVTFPFIKEKKNDSKGYDIVFIEGLVASKDDLEILKNARSKSEVLIALGSCASTGCIPAYRNFLPKKQFKEKVFKKLDEISDLAPTPIDTHVRVDKYIPGCPPDKKHILEFIKQLLLDINPKDYAKPVCFECKLNENRCLLEDNKLCLGAITVGGCEATCITGGLECWGCRGPTKDANYDVLVRLLNGKGFSEELIRSRMKMFIGMKLPKIEQKNKKKLEPLEIENRK